MRDNTPPSASELWEQTKLTASEVKEAYSSFDHVVMAIEELEEVVYEMDCERVRLEEIMERMREAGNALVAGINPLAISFTLAVPLIKAVNDWHGVECER
jgi:hypothetical protein